MKTALQTAAKNLPTPYYGPTPGGLRQRRTVNWPDVGTESDDCNNKRLGAQRGFEERSESEITPHGLERSPVQPPHAQTHISMGTRVGHDFSRVPVRADGSEIESARGWTANPFRAATRPDCSGVNYQSAVPTYRVTPTAPPPVAAVSALPTVNAITIVDSSAGAIGGYTPILGNSDLNTPGPFNHVATGEVTNVHQVQFHLDRGNSINLVPTRIVKATVGFAGAGIRFPSDLPGDPGGAGGTRTQTDGPHTHEIQRPTSDTIVIADAPGVRALAASQYPFTFEAHFELTVAAGSTDIARVKYSVQISKTSATNIPNAQNTVTATDKADLIGKRSLI